MLEIKELPVNSMKEFMSLYSEHGIEVPFASGNLPVEIDVDFYEVMEKEGYLKCVVGFVDGEVAGYLILIASPLSHHKGHFAVTTDAFYVKPEYRGNGVFSALVQYAEDLCKLLGMSAIMLEVNENFPGAAEVAASLGYTRQEIRYGKEL